MELDGQEAITWVRPYISHCVHLVVMIHPRLTLHFYLFTSIRSWGYQSATLVHLQALTDLMEN